MSDQPRGGAPIGDVMASIKKIMTEDAAPMAGRSADSEREVLVLTEFADPEPATVRADAGQPAPPAPGGLTDPVVAAAVSATLSRLVPATAPAPERSGGPTVEDVVRELLRPMLREWLDAHLPGLVERIVAEEVARLARESGRR
jgi:cell pole-organizing protein PopZ